MNQCPRATRDTNGQSRWLRFLLEGRLLIGGGRLLCSEVPIHALRRRSPAKGRGLRLCNWKPWVELRRYQRATVHVQSLSVDAPRRQVVHICDDGPRQTASGPTRLLQSKHSSIHALHCRRRTCRPEMLQAAMPTSTEVGFHRRWFGRADWLRKKPSTPCWSHERPSDAANGCLAELAASRGTACDWLAGAEKVLTVAHEAVFELISEARCLRTAGGWPRRVGKHGGRGARGHILHPHSLEKARFHVTWRCEQYMYSLQSPHPGRGQHVVIRWTPNGSLCRGRSALVPTSMHVPGAQN